MVAYFATAVPSTEWCYVDKVIHQYVFVNLVNNWKRQRVSKYDMDTRTELEEVNFYFSFVPSYDCMVFQIPEGGW